MYTYLIYTHVCMHTHIIFTNRCKHTEMYKYSVIIFGTIHFFLFLCFIVVYTFCWLEYYQLLECFPFTWWSVGIITMRKVKEITWNKRKKSGCYFRTFSCAPVRQRAGTVKLLLWWHLQPLPKHLVKIPFSKLECLSLAYNRSVPFVYGEEDKGVWPY